MATNPSATALDESPTPEQPKQSKQTIDPYNVRCAEYLKRRAGID